jgi:hypothetical protein
MPISIQEILITRASPHDLSRPPVPFTNYHDFPLLAYPEISIVEKKEDSGEEEEEYNNLEICLDVC